MNSFVMYLCALLIGVIAGLRTFTAPAAVSWAASLGALQLGGGWLAILANRTTSWIFTALAAIELVIDQLPSTPSRKIPWQFAARVASGALCGAAVTSARGAWQLGTALGVVGAIVGTLAGADARARLARTFRRDRPAAWIEDAVAIAGAILIAAVLL